MVKIRKLNDLADALKPYSRILVVGAPGAGKSYLSKKIAEQLSIPLYHLDKLFWKEGWVASTPEEFDANLAEVLDRQAFVMEGTYTSNFKYRAQKSGVVVIVEVGILRRFYRILSRTFSTAGKVRDDMAEGCIESVSWSYFKFLKWALRFQQARERILVESKEINLPVIIYHNR